MADQFTQFHYKLSKSTYHPDYEADSFDVKDIFVHSTMKHWRSPASIFMDNMFKESL